MLGPCKPWPKAIGSRGYGITWRDGKAALAHRCAYEDAYGPIPAGLVVRHRCDTPACIEPAHLELGTHADNSADMVSRGRSRGGRPNTYPDEFVALIREMAGEGLRVTQIARRLHVPHSYVSRILGGKRRSPRGNNQQGSSEFGTGSQPAIPAAAPGQPVRGPV